MFKRFLCWLLIIQHLNVYVLQAALHDISIKFFENNGEDKRPSYRFKLTQENEFNKTDVIFDREFSIDDSNFRGGTFSPKLKFASSKELTGGTLTHGDFRLFIDKNGRINLFSKLLENEFSVLFSRDGLADLGQFKTNRNIHIDTFGLIRTNQSIDSTNLSFKGRDLHNNCRLNVDYLNIDLPDNYGDKNTTRKSTFHQIINGPQGKIIINKKANIKGKTLINQGTIEGKDGSVLNLHETNLENQKAHENSQVTWDGAFAIRGVGQFINRASIQPKVKSQNSSLTLDARSFQNYGNISGQNAVSIKTLMNFENRGAIKGTQKTAIHVGGHLTNNGLISSGDDLKVEALGDLYNGVEGHFIGKRTFLRVLGYTENNGNLEGDTLTLITQSLLNSGVVKIGRDGAIILRDPNEEIINTHGGQIYSSGVLRFSGGKLINEGDDNKKGLVGAKTLVGTLSEIVNSGHIDVSERLGLIIKHFYNAEEGTWSFPSDGSVASKEFSNTKEVTTDAFQLTTQVFENFGKIISKSHVVLDVEKTFKNAAAALLSFAGGFAVTGKGEVQNDGDIIGIGQVSIDTDKSTNNGTIVSDTGVIIKSPQAFYNEGLVLSPDIEIETSGGGNRGKANESIDLANPKDLEGLIAQRNLRLKTTGEFTNSGHMFGGTGAALSGEGTFINEGRVDSQGCLESHIQSFINDGEVTAKQGILNGRLLDNYGTVFVEETSQVSFNDIQNKEGGSLNSKEGLNLGFSTFDNQGAVIAGNFVSFEGKGLKNAGEVRSQILTTGTVKKDTEGQFTYQQTDTVLDTFQNDGIFHGAALVDVKAVTLENKDEVSSKGDVNLEVEKKLLNEAGALVSALGDLSVKGSGEAHNAGNMESQNKIDIDVAKVGNTGQVISENEINVQTKKSSTNAAATDFDNEGLFLSTKINVHTTNGFNKGELSESIDLANQDALKGLVASEALNMTIDESFNNQGQMAGGNLVKLEGMGALNNSGDINHTGAIHSQLKRVDNAGVVRAHREVKFEQLTEEFNNPGLVLSEGRLSVSSASKVKNSGFMEGRQGDFDLSTNDIENTGLLSALNGKLNLKTAQGSNQNRIFGKEGIDLTVNELFTNVKTLDATSGTMESHGDVKVEGPGKLVNNNAISTAKTFDVTSGLENAGEVKAAGNITARSNDKDFINTPEGKMITPGKIDIENGKSFGNGGTMQGAEASVASTGTFSNKGLISAETGSAVVNVKAGVNDGMISGKTKADLSISESFDNRGNVTSTEAVSIHGQGKLTNQKGGALTAGGLLDVSQVQFDNSGRLASKQSIRVHDLNGKLENKATGKIISEGTTVIENVATFDNLGKVQGQKGATVSVTNLDNKGEFSSPDGPVKITTQTGSNAAKGVISSKTNTTLTISQDFTNNGDITAEQTLTLNGQGKFTNQESGALTGGELVDISQVQLDNSGKLSSQQSIRLHDLSGNLENKATGKIISEGTTSIENVATFDNFGKAQGHKETAVSITNLANNGEISSPDGAVNVTIQTGRNAATGSISSKTNTTVTTSQDFTNNGDIMAEQKVTLTGQGRVTNNNLVQGGTDVTVNSNTVTNNKDILSKGKFTLSGSSNLTNAVNGNVVSEGNFEAGANTVLTNQGLISANGSMVLNQSTMDLTGKIEVSGNLSLPNLTSLTMASGSALVSEKGQVLMPVLITLANKGKLFSHGNFVLQRLETATNDGDIQSNAAILLTSTHSIRNDKLIYGVGGVLLTTPKTLNNGDIVSGKTLGIKSAEVENNKLLAGDSGVTINDPKMTLITQGVKGKIESAKGNVTIASKKENLKGTVSGQNIEVKITEKTIVQGKTKFVPQKLLTLIPGKGFVVERSLTFDHSFTLIGELLNDLKAPLLIKGNFTWNKPTALTNKFNITTEGKLSLTIPAAWVNLASVQASAGAAINVLQFQNGNEKVSGTFYSYGGTDFVCPSGFENRGMFEAWGDLGVATKSADIANFPGATLTQRNIPKTQNTIKFVTSKNVTNTSAAVSLEGKLDSTSNFFLNTQTQSEKKVLEKIPFAEMREERITKFPESRDTPQPRASFAAGEANIKANKLQNMGSTFTTLGKFKYTGTKLENITQSYYERGMRAPSTPEEIAANTVTQTSNSKHTKCTFTYVNRISYADEIAREVAKLYAQGEIDIKIGSRVYKRNNPTGPGIQNTGDIKSKTKCNMKGGALHNAKTAQQDQIPPKFVDVNDYLSLYVRKGPSFFVEDKKKKSAFKYIPNKPIHLPLDEEIQTQFKVGGANHFDFWNVAARDLRAFAQSTTSKSLAQIPPRIALVKNSSLREDEQMRFQVHPSLLAELVTKTFVDTIGVPALSAKLQTPELQSRLMEDQGYLNAARLRRATIVPVSDRWDQMDEATKLSNQQKAFVTKAETEFFKQPSIVYQIKVDRGESVMSPSIVFPEYIRKQFTAVAGRIAANYLEIDNKEIKNKGGSIVGQSKLNVKTTGDIHNDHAYMGGKGETTLNAGRTATNISSTVEGACVKATARDFVTETATERQSTVGGWRDVLHARATYKANKGDLNMTALGSHISKGGLYTAKRDANFITAGQHGFVSQTMESDTSEKSKKHSYHRHNLTHQKTEVKSGRNNNYTVLGDLIFQGFAEKAKASNATVGGKIIDSYVSDEVVEESSSKKKGSLFRAAKSKFSQKESSTANVNTHDLTSFNWNSAGDIIVGGSRFSAKPNKGKLTSKNGKVHIKAAESSSVSVTSKSGGNAFIASHKKREVQETTHTMAQLPRGVEIKAKKGVEVDILKTLSQLESNPATAWIKDVRKLPNVKWNQVEDVYKVKKHKSHNLTAGGAAVLGLAVAIVAGPVAAEIAGVVAGGLGGSIGVAAGHVAAAGFKYLVQQVALCVGNQIVNKKLDIKKLFKDLGSKGNLRGLANAMGVAAVVGGADLPAGGVSNTKELLDFVKSNALSAVAQGGIDIAQGKKAKDVINQGLINIAVDAAAKVAAGKIGQHYAKGDLDFITHKMAHAVLGGGIGAILAKDKTKGFVTGAVAGAVAEIIADVSCNASGKALEAMEKARARGEKPSQSLFNSAYQKEVNNSGNLGKLGAAFATLFLGQDVQLGNRVAQNAIENNFIPMVVVYGVYAAGALWTAYEVYSVGRDQGVEAALQELALQGAIGVATGAAGKVVYKVGKVSYMSAAAAWKAYLAESPVMRAVIGQLGEWGAKVVNKAANAPAVKKAVNVAAAVDKKAQGVAEKFIPKAAPANGASVGNANAKGAQQPAPKQSAVAPKSTRQEGVPPQKMASHADDPKLPPKLTREYLKDMEDRSGINISGSQRSLLKVNLQKNNYVKLEGEGLKMHHKNYANSNKSDLIHTWEKNTSQKWPKYKEDVLKNNGEVLYKAGDDYEIHHIIHQSHGGPHKWWNIHPMPRGGHQAGVHKKNAPGQVLHNK